MSETAIIYARASRDPKALGASVDAQIRLCAKWAEQEHATVVETIRDDNRSASAARSREREGFGRVLELVARRASDLLIVYETSRTARDLGDFVKLREACATAGVTYCSRGRRYDMARGDDAFAATLDALVAEREANNIRDNNRRTAATRRDARRPHGRIPYGYRRIYDPTNGALIGQEPDFRESMTDPYRPGDVVRGCIDRLLAGATLRQLCREMNEQGIPSPRRPRKSTPEADRVTGWDPSSLRQILLNPTVGGLYAHDGTVLGDASWEGIVPAERWWELRTLLKDPARLTVTTPRGPAPRHLLTGIAVCGVCNSRVKASTNRHRLPRAYECRAEGCMKVTISADRADEVVLAVLRLYLARDDVREALTEAHRPPSQPSINVAAQRRETLQRQLADARSEFLDEKLSAATLGLLEKAINARLAELDAEAVSRVPDPSVRALLRAGDMWLAWQAADLMEQRAVLRALFSIKVNPATGNHGRRFDPSRVVIEAVHQA